MLSLRKDDAVVGQFGLVTVAAEIEPRLAVQSVQLEAHLASHHQDHAYQAVPVGDPLAPTRA